MLISVQTLKKFSSSINQRANLVWFTCWPRNSKTTNTKLASAMKPWKKWAWQIKNDKLRGVNCIAKYQAAKEVYAKVCNEISSILPLHYIVPETKMSWIQGRDGECWGKKNTRCYWMKELFVLDRVTFLWSRYIVLDQLCHRSQFRWLHKIYL